MLRAQLHTRRAAVCAVVLFIAPTPFNDQQNHNGCCLSIAYRKVCELYLELVISLQSAVISHLPSPATETPYAIIAMSSRRAGSRNRDCVCPAGPLSRAVTAVLYCGMTFSLGPHATALLHADSQQEMEIGLMR